MRAVTLTLHPAIDRVIEVAHLRPGDTFDARLKLCVPSGKGVNTARGLRSLWPMKNKIVAAAWVGAAEAPWFAAQLKTFGIEAALFLRECAKDASGDEE